MQLELVLRSYIRITRRQTRARRVLAGGLWKAIINITGFDDYGVGSHGVLILIHGNGGPRPQVGRKDYLHGRRLCIAGVSPSKIDGILDLHVTSLFRYF